MMFEFAMYYLSFFPLWMSIILIDGLNFLRGDENLWTEGISIILILLGILGSLKATFDWLKEEGNQNRQEYLLESAKEERFATAEFLMSYVLPLFAFEFTKWDGVVLFLLFFSIFWFLVHRHRYFCTNLILEFFGYRIFDCEMTIKNQFGGERISKLVISKEVLENKTGHMMKTRKFNDDYHFECGFNEE